MTTERLDFALMAVRLHRACATFEYRIETRRMLQPSRLAGTAISLLLGIVVGCTADSQLMGNGSAIDEVSGEQLEIVEEDVADEPPPASSTRDVRAITALRAEAIGVTGGVLSELGVLSTHRAGFASFSGSYVSSDTSEKISAVWSGPVDSPRMILSSIHHLPGLPATVEFRGVADGDDGLWSPRMALSVASNGSTAVVASLGGSRQTTAVIVVPPDADPYLLAETGMILTVSGMVRTVEAFTDLSHARGGTAFQAETTVNVDSRSSVTLWIERDGELTIVATTVNDPIHDAITFDGCNVFLRGSSNEFRLLDSGSLVFEAALSAPPNAQSDSCISASAIFRYGPDGTFSPVVTVEDPVPGTRGMIFGSADLIDVLADGTAVVSASLYEPSVNPTGGGYINSVWLFSPQGDPSLLLLDGEEILLDDVKSVIGSTPNVDFFDIAANGKTALVTWFSGHVGTVLIGGSARIGQPYADLRVPGASSLTRLADATTVLPDPYPRSAYLGDIRSVAVGRDGSVFFPASVPDTEQLQAFNRSAVFSIDSDGVLTRLIADDDAVRIDDSRRSVFDLLGGPTFGGGLTSPITLFDDGSLLLEGREALLYLGSPGR